MKSHHPQDATPQISLFKPTKTCTDVINRIYKLNIKFEAIKRGRLPPIKSLLVLHVYFCNLSIDVDIVDLSKVVDEK